MVTSAVRLTRITVTVLLLLAAPHHCPIQSLRFPKSENRHCPISCRDVKRNDKEADAGALVHLTPDRPRNSAQSSSEFLRLRLPRCEIGHSPVVHCSRR